MQPPAAANTLRFSAGLKAGRAVPCPPPTRERASLKGLSMKWDRNETHVCGQAVLFTPPLGAARKIWEFTSRRTYACVYWLLPLSLQIPDACLHTRAYRDARALTCTRSCIARNKRGLFTHSHLAFNHFLWLTLGVFCNQNYLLYMEVHLHHLKKW